MNSKEELSVLDIETGQLTPGMKQYQEAKKQHPDCLVMLRMGDFYEMFYEDAVTASRELEITLTARGKGDKRAPLAGIPFHALDSYLGRLVKKGYKVAIVEQLEDPKKAKGLVKRGLVRIITPGTIIEPTILNEQENNYIAAITAQNELFAIAFSDLSTGEFFTTAVAGLTALLGELTRYHPSECVVPESLCVNNELMNTITSTGCFITKRDDYSFREEAARRTLLQHFNLTSLHAFGIEDKATNVVVAGGLLQYFLETQKNTLSHIKTIALRSNQSTMLLDANTFKNLELTRNIAEGTGKGTLLEVMDETKTSMGARLLKQWLSHPLVHLPTIQQRLDAVEELTQNIIMREELKELFTSMYDLERLISRVNYGNATPRDLLSLKTALKTLPFVKEKLAQLSSPLLQQINTFSCLPETALLLENAIKDDASITVREGNIIRPSFHAELQQLQDLQKNSKHYLQRLEERERQNTNIPTLKIGYTKVFGYYIEITRKNVDKVPHHYIRKQTTVNSERYITEELKQEEENILHAEERSIELEYTLFQEILRTISQQTAEIQDISGRIAMLDILCSFATVASEHNYCKPSVTLGSTISIRNGRHPIVENYTSRFIPNDVLLNEGEMMLITGPNMAGKSTIMRQTALIVLMAQMGSFVPAEEAVLGLVDRIFTRVGASDNLRTGQSTFMTEMNETAAILHNATDRSLIILDEIGRGTSTFDGVSIAWSVAEYIYNHVRAKTMFATHYHVLNKLAEKCGKIRNYNIAVKEIKGEVIFLHKLVEGGTDESYGIYVAELAGLPKAVVERAKEIQAILQNDDVMIHKLKAKKLQEQKSLGEF